MNNEVIQNIADELTPVRRMSLSSLLLHPFSKMAMSLGELINNTSKRSVKYTKGCTATLAKSMPKIGRWTFTVKCTERWSKGPYSVRFKLLKGRGRKTKGVLGREILVSCNCRAWQYNGADYNATNKDYSERQYSDGSAPNIRDPRRKYLICKHVAACVPIIKKFIIPSAFK